MAKHQEKNLDNDLNVRTVEEVLSDFITALDETIATYKILENIPEEDTRPNQLLFCHVINSFDSFINSLLYTILLSNNEKLKGYFEKNTNLEEKINFKELMNILDVGLNQWMKGKSITIIEQDLSRKRHSQKVELLLSTIGVEYKKIYVYLTGPGKNSTGYFKKNPTPESKKGTNHKTTSEKLIGYADILYEKRNAITHNKNFYLDKTISRLNQEHGLQISRSGVIIKSTTIKGVLRFYTSFCLELLKCSVISDVIQLKSAVYETQLKDLQEIKNLTTSLNSGIDSRFRDGGIDGRKEKLISANPRSFNTEKYQKITGATSTTAYRDLKKLVEEKIIIKKKRGIYSIKSQNQKGVLAPGHSPLTPLP